MCAMKKQLTIALFAAISMGSSILHAAYLIEVDIDGLDDGNLLYSPDFAFGGDTTEAYQSVAATAVGLTLTYGATAGLGLTDRLAGPSLLPTGGAVLEGFVFGAIGAIGGFVFAIWHRQ